MSEFENKNQPSTGAYENMDPNAERKPRITWDLINEEGQHTVTFVKEKPKEYPSSDGEGVFYIFDVLEGGEEKVILTSAWSLLNGIKALEPIKGKTILITKRQKGKIKFFEVIDPTAPIEEVVKD